MEFSACVVGYGAVPVTAVSPVTAAMVPISTMAVPMTRAGCAREHLSLKS